MKMVIEMLRLKYYSLTKEEKYNIKEEFYKTDFGKSINYRLNRLLITGVLGILFSIYLFIDAKNTLNYIVAILLLISSIIFIVGSFKVRIVKINDYLVKKKK